MSDGDKSRAIVDASEIALAATGAIVGGAPGAALSVLAVLVNKMLPPLHQFRKAREVRFLERVSHFLEENDPEGAAQFVAEHAVDQKFSDALDRGYEKMRRAFDPLAEECICVLVADHIRSGQVTDRRFVRTGSLLEVSDKAVLTTINRVCEAYLVLRRSSELTRGRPMKETRAWITERSAWSGSGSGIGDCGTCGEAARPGWPMYQDSVLQPGAHVVEARRPEA